MKPGAKMPLDPNEPLYVIELGAGSGKFSYLMLKALHELREISDFPVDKIIYVMTDFTESNFNFWRGHAALKVMLLYFNVASKALIEVAFLNSHILTRGTSRREYSMQSMITRLLCARERFWGREVRLTQCALWPTICSTLCTTTYSRFPKDN
jgi:hypothetical protein